MATMADLRRRADQLFALGLTAPRVLRVLRRENPWGERDMLINASRIEGYHRRVTPVWATHGQALRPVIIRWQSRGRPELPVVKSERKVVAMNYPLMTVEAKDLRKKDWIDGQGTITKLGLYSTMIYVEFTSGETTFFRPRQEVIVRIEDEGVPG